MVSSRKEENVRKAVESLKGMEGGKVEGMVCHVGKSDHRTNLIKEVKRIEHYMCRSDHCSPSRQFQSLDSWISLYPTQPSILLLVLHLK